MESLPVSKKRKRSQEPEIQKVTEEAVSPTANSDAPAVDDTEPQKILTYQETANVQKKIFHTIKEAGRAFKKARDFEVRKIIKRIKAAKETGDTSKLERLEKELHIAKSLDVHPYAHAYVYKKLQADELFIGNPDLLSEHSPPVMEVSSDDAVIKNIVGRLASTAVVKTTMTISLNAIHRAAGMEVPYEQAQSKSKGQKPLLKAKNTALQSSKSQKSAPQRESPADDGRPIDPVALLNLIEKGNPLSDSEFSEHDSQISDEDQPRPTSPPSKQSKQSRLPALSTGYILPSDSESDPDQEYASFAPLKKERKNRRGQRERQAIWLKKYGSAAKHLHPELKQQSTSKSEDTKEKKTRRGVGGDEPREAVAPAIEPPAKKVNDPHPSWVAKQKLREQQQAVMHSAKAKKIVFD